MYGLLLENLADYVKEAYDEDTWEIIRREAKVETSSFSTHQVYPETIVPKLARTACKVLNVSEQEFFENMGVFFVKFVGQYGYDRVLSVLGRNVRDFLNGLDNLHEYLRFSYPRMKPPSFFCENETEHGTMLHYRSKRKGYGFYTMGQIKQVARHFYDTEIQMEVIREDTLPDSFQVTFQLTFDNQSFRESTAVKLVRDEQRLPLRADVLFELFPFSVAFTQELVVKNVGMSLYVVLPELIGQKMNDWFDIVRPIIEFRFTTIIKKTNNIFELISTDPPLVMQQLIREKGKSKGLINIDDTEDTEEKNLRLKGQMLYFEQWKMLMFLSTPVLEDLDTMIHTGLFINDLSMHDFSRDLVLAGAQQSVEMKLALDQEQIKSKKLEASMRKLDEEMQRTDELLYQMIPKQVATRLRNGENPVDTCEVFESVTVLFSDVVTFTDICSRITPLQVVSLLNSMYSIFDQLVEHNDIYKVETIGDSYMAVGGVPAKQQNHAEMTCNMALDMLDGIKGLTDPSTGNHIKIRVGLHSGMVVAGVVGVKMPRYCLFGDTVNTASRMESNSLPMKVHISQTTKELISGLYHVSERGEVQIKGKGAMKTYWLDTYEGRKPLAERITLDVVGNAAEEMTRPFVASSRSRRSLLSSHSSQQSGRRASVLSAVSVRAEDLVQMNTAHLSDIKRARSSASSRLSASPSEDSPLLSFPIPSSVMNDVQSPFYTDITLAQTSTSTEAASATSLPSTQQVLTAQHNPASGSVQITVSEVAVTTPPPRRSVPQAIPHQPAHEKTSEKNTTAKTTVDGKNGVVAQESQSQRHKVADTSHRGVGTDSSPHPPLKIAEAVTAAAMTASLPVHSHHLALTTPFSKAPQPDALVATPTRTRPLGHLEQEYLDSVDRLVSGTDGCCGARTSAKSSLSSHVRHTRACSIV